MRVVIDRLFGIVIKSLRGSVYVSLCLCSVTAAAQTVVPQSPLSRAVVPIGPHLAAPPVISLQVGDILTINGALAYDIGGTVQRYQDDETLFDPAPDAEAGLGLSISSPDGRLSGAVSGNAAMHNGNQDQYRGSVSITLRF